MSFDELIHMRILEREVAILEDRFQDADTGNLRTAVNVLNNRIQEIEDSISEMLARK
jgi:hypothetical protein